MTLAAALISYCRDRADHDSLLSFAREFEPVLRGSLRDENVEVTGQELRSALFWRFIQTEHSDIRLLEAESRIMGALCGCQADQVLKADAALTQGYNRK